MDDPAFFPAVDGESSTADQLRELERQVAALRERLAEATTREQQLREELRHRVRNLLATIRTVFRRSREGGASQEKLAEHFGARLDAIARFQAGLTGGPRGGLELEDVIRDELLHIRSDESADFVLDGPPVRLRGKVLELIGLAIHELTTNAVKFGALSDGGMLAVRWSVDDGDGRRSLRLHWRETGVAMVGAAPRPSGFGRQLIEEALPYELDATVAFELKPGGVSCLLIVPLPADPLPGELDA